MTKKIKADTKIERAPIIPWTTQQEQILTHYIVLGEEEGLSVSASAKQASVHLSRTHGACAFRWYSVLNPKVEAGTWEKKKLAVVPEAIKEAPVVTEQVAAPDFDLMSISEVKDYANIGYILAKQSIQRRTALLNLIKTFG